MPKKRTEHHSHTTPEHHEHHITVNVPAHVSTATKKKKAGGRAKKAHVAHVVHGSAIEHEVLKNLVELQKVHLNLAEKFDGLSKEISHLLALFEVTARSFAKNAPQTVEYQKDKDFLDKVDKLLEQNKVLAKGLSIMEDQIRERMYAPPQQHQQERKMEEVQPGQPALSSRRPLPKF